MEYDSGNPQESAATETARRSRWISLRILFPNLLTLLAICAGMTGIRLAFEGRFEVAVIMVLAAAFIDGIDGRAARMLKATSNFGAQMDSLADIVNFGVAPALVLYAFLLDQAGSFGWIAAMLYAIACGLRLARFNVMLEDPNRPAWQSAYFVGVPAPMGAGCVMLPVYLGFLGLEPGPGFAAAAVVYTILVAYLLVSRLPVYSGKTLGSRVRRDAVIPIILGAVAYVLFLFSYPWQTLVASTVIYFGFLPFSVLAYQKRMKREEAAGLSDAAPR